MSERSRRRWPTRAILVVACLAAWNGVSPRASATTCEYPLFITEGSVEANVLFIFDNSGSMNEAVWHEDYDPDITYTGDLAGSMYYISRSGWYTVNGGDAWLVQSDHGQSGRYTGNYLNWVYYHATPGQRAAIPAVTRVQVAKAAVTDIIANNPGVRFGVMRFNTDSEGGSVVAEFGTGETELISAINGIVADTWTPIAETMVDAGDYYAIRDADAPIQYGCQKNFLVIVSDGFPTMDRNGSVASIGDRDGDGREPGSCASIGAPYDDDNNCSDYMDDVAAYLLESDLRPDLAGEQNVVTYAIGFNVDAQLFLETAVNGGGMYLSANNPRELQESLNTVLADIANRISSGSAVAVVSNEGESEDLLLRGKFLPTGWRGYLEAFALPYEPGGTPVWEAGEILSDRDPATRSIFTAVGGSQLEFHDGAADVLAGPLGVAAPEEAVNLINWGRGEEVDGYRDRGGWLLGDVIDSSPVVVGSPRSFHAYGDYTSFRTEHQFRNRVVYVGSNDGMLHCFRENDGEELWAFVPESVLPRLKNLADEEYCHEYFLDLTPTAADVMIGGSWKTILLGGMRSGGGSYCAIDVTYPEYPVYLWETAIPKIGESWARPEIARVADMDKFIAFVGSGPDRVNGEARLIAIDLENGGEVWSEQLSTAGAGGRNMATAATAVDVDFDGYHDFLYAGDLTGRLWRLDLRTAPWSRTLLFETDQPIQAQPVVTVDYNNDVFVYFGTGVYVDPADIPDATRQSFYCVIDNHSGICVKRLDLVDQTADIHPVSAANRGWYIDLDRAVGERIVEPDALVAGIVYFTTFAPVLEPCAAGGYSWLYKVKFRNGAAEDGDDDDGNDGTEGRIEEIGQGIAARAVVDVVNEKVIVQGSDTRIHVKDTAGEVRRLIVRSWRHLY